MHVPVNEFGELTMSAVDVGRICIKLTGREAGKNALLRMWLTETSLLTGPKQVNGVKCRWAYLREVVKPKF